MTGPTLTTRGESVFTGLIVAGLFASAALAIAALVGVLELVVAVAAWLVRS